MLKVATLSIKDREALFRNTAQKCGMNEAIVEKDFLGMLDDELSIPAF